MKSGSNRRKGFALIEAMVASVLVAIGVAGAIRGYASLTRAQATVQERDRMQRLAVSKYDELLAEGIDNAPTSGDFQDYNEDRYKWQADIQTTSTAGLETIRVSVTSTDASDQNEAHVDGMVYSPQTSSSTGAGG